MRFLFILYSNNIGNYPSLLTLIAIVMCYPAILATAGLVTVKETKNENGSGRHMSWYLSFRHVTDINGINVL